MTHLSESVRTIIDDKLTSLGVGQEFKDMVFKRYLPTITESVEEMIDEEIDYIVTQSEISITRTEL
ncbi:MAG: hypothetical protein EOL93_00520 [Epsilonproteobacteria bacterium]|nr:hypothetical protein [Campylobacterota bacterium]